MGNREFAYQLGGTWSQDGETKIVAQKTVVIAGADGLYVLQLNADGLENQGDIVGAATNVIDDRRPSLPDPELPAPPSVEWRVPIAAVA